jgi:dCTP deaminase
MILNWTEIHKEHKKGNIQIEPFYYSQLRYNSYDVRLDKYLIRYTDTVIDPLKDNPSYEIIEIPESGLVLNPQELYLGKTVEYTETHFFVPMIEGRSTIGRGGLSVHVTAGIGDEGFCGYWTLEMHCIKPYRVYSNMRIAQLLYYSTTDSDDEYANIGINNLHKTDLIFPNGYHDNGNYNTKKNDTLPKIYKPDNI